MIMQLVEIIPKKIFSADFVHFDSELSENRIQRSTNRKISLIISTSVFSILSNGLIQMIIIT